MEFWPSCGPHRHGFLTADALGTTLLSITQGRRAVLLDPLNPRSHEALGAALYYARRYDEAIAAWTRALSLDPKDSLTAGERGYAHIALGQYDAALRTCNVVALEYTNSVCLAVAYDKLGRRPEADATIQQLRESDGERASYQFAEITPNAANWATRWIGSTAPFA
jgi:Flp pilus assembly protein TadD